MCLRDATIKAEVMRTWEPGLPDLALWQQSSRGFRLINVSVLSEARI